MKYVFRLRQLHVRYCPSVSMCFDTTMCSIVLLETERKGDMRAENKRLRTSEELIQDGAKRMGVKRLSISHGRSMNDVALGCYSPKRPRAGAEAGQADYSCGFFKTAAGSIANGGGRFRP